MSNNTDQQVSKQENQEQKQQVPQFKTFKFEFSFAKQPIQQKQEEKPEEKPEQELTKSQILKNLPSVKEEIYYKQDQIKYFIFSQNKKKYEKQDQLIEIQLYKQETEKSKSKCIRIQYKNNNDKQDDQYVQNIFFSTIKEQYPIFNYIKGRGMTICGPNLLHQQLDKDKKETGNYEISQYYLKLSDEQMDKFKEIVQNIIDNKECKVIETVTTGKFVQDEKK